MDTTVVGVDQSPGSLRALRWAMGEAGFHRARLRIVQVVPYPMRHDPYGIVEMERATAAMERTEVQVSDRLAALLAEEGGPPEGVEVELAPRFGEAPAVLVDEAREATLLVVGSRGRGGFAGLLLGSVSQQVIQHAWCPVAVIASPGRGEVG